MIIMLNKFLENIGKFITSNVGILMLLGLNTYLLLISIAETQRLRIIMKTQWDIYFNYLKELGKLLDVEIDLDENEELGDF